LLFALHRQEASDLYFIIVKILSMKTYYFVKSLKLGLLWALLAALPCVQTLMAQYSNRNIIITPPQKLSEGEEDNERGR